MPIPVYLNIYDLISDVSKANVASRTILDKIGMGMYHTGIEILGREISFGRDATGRNDPAMEGVFMVTPRTACAFWKDQVLLGTWTSPSEPVDATDEEQLICFYEAKLEEYLAVLRPKWRSASYHMLKHNCNDFTFDLASLISSKGESKGVDYRSNSLLDRYPKWINRAAGMGTVVVPDAILTKAIDSIHPPCACAPDLINSILVSSPFGPSAPTPLPLELTPIRRVTLTGTSNHNNTGSSPTASEATPSASSTSKAKGLLMGGLKMATGLVKNVTARTKIAASSHIDARDRRQFVEIFGGGGSAKNDNGVKKVPTVVHATRTEGCGSLADDLVSAYQITVRHIHRDQPNSKVFLTPQGLYFSGSNQLNLNVPWSCVASIRVATVTDNACPERRTAPPTYTLVPQQQQQQGLNPSHPQQVAITPALQHQQPKSTAIIVFLNQIPPQLSHVPLGDITSQMDECAGGGGGGDPSSGTMMIPMRRFTYGTFYNADEVLQNALGHMNFLWQASRSN